MLHFRYFSQTTTRGFSLIELMIAIAIMGVVAAAGVGGYLTSIKSSRDARRKIDIDSIRNALEIYRSNQINSFYPTTAQGLSCLEGGQTAPCDTKYMTVPKDPSEATPTIGYAYEASPSGCDNATTYCSSYTVGTYLESVSSTTTCTPTFNHCTFVSGSTACNYCRDPYGAK